VIQREGHFTQLKLRLCYFLILFCESCSVFASPHTIDALKVAYIYNIAKFTHWSETTWYAQSDPFELCIYEENNFNEELATLQNKVVNGHPINILRPEKELDFQYCHAFYIKTSKRYRYRYLLSLINQKNVLVITDNSPFFDYGGLVNLVEVAHRLRFQINKQQLDNSLLKFSSKLLQLAILIDNSRHF